MTLAELLETQPDKEPIAPFPALLNSQSVNVTAVLERTAIADDGSGRRVVRLDALSVNPALVQWKSDSGGRFSENGAPFVRGREAFSHAQTSPKSGADRAERRRQGDQRALKDQAELAAKLTPAGVKVAVKRPKPKRSAPAKQRTKSAQQRRRRPPTDTATHCASGHEMTPENTIIRQRNRGCRICVNEAQKRYRLAHPAKRLELNPERHRRYYAEHRDAIRERKRQWYQRRKGLAA